MKTVNKSVLIWYSPEDMYALVTDVASYPQFLPWCDRSRVIEAHEGGATAEVGIAFSGLRKSFVTRNTNTTMDNGGQQVSMAVNFNGTTGVARGRLTAQALRTLGWPLRQIV